MRLLVQRVREANVQVGGQSVGKIGPGLLAFVGFGQMDGPDLPTSRAWSGMLDKLVHTRIFPGEEPHMADKMDRHVLDFGGQILLVSQFTLYADCRRGRRPDFMHSAPPQVAEPLFTRFTQDVDACLPSRVESGIFGALMEVTLTNWGPVTLMLDSEELFPAAPQA